MSAEAPISYEDAIARILEAVPAPTSPALRPVGSFGRAVVMQDIVAAVDLPPFANSAMDGFACIAADTAGASASSPACLRIIGESAAGRLPSGRVASGTAMRISTGAPIPGGADAVVMVEETRLAEESGCVEILASASTGQFVRGAGEDVRRGDVVARAGRPLRPGQLALLVAAGNHRVSVAPPPLVAPISIGDELVEPMRPLGDAQIYDANHFMLAALIEESGAWSQNRYWSKDHPDDLRRVLDEAVASKPAAIVTSGAVSVGPHDHVKEVVESNGAIAFWRVAIRPGKPFAFGNYRGIPFFGLPGNPASTLVTFELFVRPALRRMAGYADPLRPEIEAVLGEAVEHEPDRRSYMRAVVKIEHAKPIVRPAGLQASHRFRSLSDANALLIVPEDRARLEAGETARVLLFGLD